MTKKKGSKNEAPWSGDRFMPRHPHGNQEMWRSPDRLRVAWIGHHRILGSYGIVTDHLCDALERVAGDRIALTRRGRLAVSSTQNVAVMHVWPRDMAVIEIEGLPKRVLYMDWGCEGWPREWHDTTAELDEVWVPSAFCRRSALAHVRCPVRIVPHGIDPELFRPERPPLKIDGLRTIRFLSVAGVQSNDQKNWRGLLRAWADAFAPGDDVCLIAHGYPGCENELAAMIRDHFAARESAPVIMLRHSIDMPRLYATADVFALASKGEGFCLAALEAAASGLFIVAPRSTGLTDFLDDETARLVKVKREPVLDLPPLYRAGDSHWYPPVHDDLVDALRGAAEAVSAMPAIGFGRTRTDQGMRASSRVRERFTWDRAAEQAWVYLRLLNGWRERKSVGACPQTATAGG